MEAIEQKPQSPFIGQPGQPNNLLRLFMQGRQSSEEVRIIRELGQLLVAAEKSRDKALLYVSELERYVERLEAAVVKGKHATH